jgi:hypothetical protein
MSAGMRGRTRVVAIALRTGHVAAMTGVVGGVWLGAPHADIRPWAALTALTGLGLVATEVAHGREWPFQGRGVASILHLAVLAAAALPGAAPGATMTALVIGMAGSHMPRGWRKWSFRQRRVVD